MEKPNKRGADLERARQIILSVTSELFMARGPKNTSTREITLKMNITQPSLCHHFKNKRKLYLAMIGELMSRVQEGLVLIVSGNTSVGERLYRLVKVLLDERPANLFLVLSDMFQEIGPDYNHTLYQIFKKTYINNIAAVFGSEPGTNYSQEGINVNDATRFILCNISALLSTEKTYQRKTVDGDVKKFVQSMLHDALKDHK